MKHALSLAAALCGVCLILFGIIKYQNADLLRQDARNYLRQQDDARIIFHENAQALSKRYQAGEIDSAEWHKETAVIQSQHQKDTNQAGMAWTDSLNAAHKSHTLALFLFIGGMITIAASVFYLLNSEPNSGNET